MKLLPNTVAGLFALGATLPVFAGPDWSAIEQARKNQRSQMSETSKRSPVQVCTSKSVVLPLDHGPRAQTTPYANELRRQRVLPELNACQRARLLPSAIL